MWLKLTFTRPLAITSDVSAALLKRSFACHFIAEEDHSILTKTRSQKRFFVSDKKINSYYKARSIYLKISIRYPLPSIKCLLVWKKETKLRSQFSPVR